MYTHDNQILNPLFPSSETIDYQIYDRIITKKDGDNTLFSIPQHVKGKTAFDTNILLFRKLPVKQNFLIKSIQGYCEQETAFCFHVGNKSYTSFTEFSLFNYILQAPLLLTDSYAFYMECLNVTESYRVSIKLIGLLFRPVLPLTTN